MVASHSAPGRCLAPLAFLASLLLAGCDDTYPEIVIVNDIDEGVLVRDIGFNGCLWTEVLAYGEASKPQRCLPGAGRVHFEKLDVTKPTDAEPLWFCYQTRAEYEVDHGDFDKLVLRTHDLEEDFSVPGPYGH